MDDYVTKRIRVDVVVGAVAGGGRRDAQPGAVALALWVCGGSAHAQEPVPFDYAADAAAAATPAALLATAGSAPRTARPGTAGSPRWLRIDVAPFAPRIPIRVEELIASLVRTEPRTDEQETTP